MARPRKTVTSNQQRSIVARYKKGEGLVEIAEAIKLGIPVVRRVLVDNKITIRGRGRPVTA